MRLVRYGLGDELSFEVAGVFPARPARVRLAVEAFAGGGSQDRSTA